MTSNLRRSIYVGNLPEATSYDVLWNEFKKFGNIMNITIPVDIYSNKPKGYAFVEFADPKDAEAAVETMNGTKLWGRTLFVQHTRSHPKTSREMALRAQLTQSKNQVPPCTLKLKNGSIRSNSSRSSRSSRHSSRSSRRHRDRSRHSSHDEPSCRSSTRCSSRSYSRDGSYRSASSSISRSYSRSSSSVHTSRTRGSSTQSVSPIEPKSHLIDCKDGRPYFFFIMDDDKVPDNLIIEANLLEFPATDSHHSPSGPCKSPRSCSNSDRSSKRRRRSSS